jgi:hypothetical protein
MKFKFEEVLRRLRAKHVKSMFDLHFAAPES